MLVVWETVEVLMSSIGMHPRIQHGIAAASPLSKESILDSAGPPNVAPRHGWLPIIQPGVLPVRIWSRIRPSSPVQPAFVAGYKVWGQGKALLFDGFQALTKIESWAGCPDSLAAQSEAGRRKIWFIRDVKRSSQSEF